MSEIAIVAVLYLVGVLVLLAEIFIPSHGSLSVLGTILLGAAVFKTFAFGRDAGIVAVLAVLVFLPTFAALAIKYWHKTPVGRRISPENPVFAREDGSIPIREIEALVGQTGKAQSTLRPAGICEFHGRRYTCVAQIGMIDAGVEVEGVGIINGTLAVAQKKAGQGL